jgi:proline iminopeptidase
MLDAAGCRAPPMPCVVQGSGFPTMVIGSAIYYPRTFSARLRQSLRMAFMDLRHFSASAAGSPHEITIDTYVEDIKQTFASLGFERVLLIGHSHHGNMAMEYAKRHPTTVSGVVLIGSPPCDVATTITAADRYWIEQGSDHRKAALRDRWASLDPQALAMMDPRQAYIARYVADGPRYWYDHARDASDLWDGVPINDGAMKAFRGFFAHYELCWDPEQLTAPVLVVMGLHDYAVPHVLWDSVLPRLCNVRFRLLDRSGHTPQLEEPDQFDEVLLTWMAA